MGILVVKSVILLVVALDMVSADEKQSWTEIVKQLQTQNSQIHQLVLDNTEFRQTNSHLQQDVDQLKKTNSELIKTNSYLREDIIDLKQTKSDQNKDIAALQDDNAALRDDITELTNDNKNMKDDITELTNNNKNMKDDNTNCINVTTELSQDFTSLKDDVTGLKQYRGQAATENIAFRASFATDFSASSLTTIPYDRTELNLGDAYNNVTFTFTAPIRGVYYLYSNNMYYDADPYHYIYMYHNSNIVRQCYMYTADWYSSTTCSVVLYMEAGDTAHVELEGYINGDIPPYSLSEFGGFIVHEII